MIQQKPDRVRMTGGSCSLQGGCMIAPCYVDVYSTVEEVLDRFKHTKRGSIV